MGNVASATKDPTTGFYSVTVTPRCSDQACKDEAAAKSKGEYYKISAPEGIAQSKSKYVLTYGALCTRDSKDCYVDRASFEQTVQTPEAVRAMVQMSLYQELHPDGDMQNDAWAQTFM